MHNPVNKEHAPDCAPDPTNPLHLRAMGSDNSGTVENQYTDHNTSRHALAPVKLSPHIKAFACLKLLCSYNSCLVVDIPCSTWLGNNNITNNNKLYLYRTLYIYIYIYQIENNIKRQNIRLSKHRKLDWCNYSTM